MQMAVVLASSWTMADRSVGLAVPAQQTGMTFDLGKNNVLGSVVR